MSQVLQARLRSQGLSHSTLAAIHSQEVFVMRCLMDFQISILRNLWILFLTATSTFAGELNGQFTNLYDFNASSPRDGGSDPVAGVVFSGTKMFGTTWRGGSGSGSLWSYETSTGTYANLYDFNTASDGHEPEDLIVEGHKLYGVAWEGGANDHGTLWSYDPNADVFTTLHEFDSAIDGKNPAGLVSTGTMLYGTSWLGGTNNHGTLWSYDLSGSSFSTLHNLSKASDGWLPNKLLLSGSTLLGSAAGGGLHNGGTLWSYDTSARSFATLHDFNASSDGSGPYISVEMTGSSVIGTAKNGGVHDQGTLWSYDIGADEITTLHHFGTWQSGESSQPIDRAVLVGTRLFGTTYVGGQWQNSPFYDGDGTLWSYDTATGDFSKLHDFFKLFDGQWPRGRLAVHGDTLYGTAQLGGTNDSGTLWSYVPPEVITPDFVMDGILDSNATEVANVGGNHLYAAVQGDLLYVATEDAGEGNDVFIYLAETPGEMVPANWAKAGQIAQWDAYLADENSNDYEGWFDAIGSTRQFTGINGGVLEGTINLAEQFGTLPEEVYLAVAHYQNWDGGALLPSAQIPATQNGDGNLDPNEYIVFSLSTVLPGDFDGDGDVDGVDFLYWQRNPGVGNLVDWQANYGSPTSSSSKVVPEPSALMLILAGLVTLANHSRRL